MVTFDLDDLQSERSYAQQRAHAQSKHAVQMFGFELDRRLRAAGADIRSIVAHPGLGLDGASPRRDGVNEPSTLTGVSARLLSPIAQGKNRSAWAALRAAVDRRRRRRPVLRSGARRHRQTRPRAAAEGEQGPAAGAQLWTVSQELTGASTSPHQPAEHDQL
jgi:NAD(P)-dependent dehydrogenase (short-subunit alcohol dehydrogenase family)